MEMWDCMPTPSIRFFSTSGFRMSLMMYACLLGEYSL